MNSLDILIPTYNEEQLLPDCLSSLAIAVEFLLEQRPESVDVSTYLIDANSSDRTLEVAESFGVNVIQCPQRGRGVQFAYGIENSSSDLILMLHADSVITKSGLLELMETITDSPALAWGILGHSYSNASKRFKWVQLSNFLRFVCLGIAFGDQGIFVKRKVLPDIGGMPDFKLMEDVELSLRLRKISRGMKVGGPLTVSARRWERKGSINYTLQVISLVSRFLTLRFLGADMANITDDMYQEYYCS